MTGSLSTPSRRRRLSGPEPAAEGGRSHWPHTAWLFLLLVLAPTSAMLVMSARSGFLSPPLNVDLFGLYILSILVARASQWAAVAVAISGLAAIVAIQILVAVGLIYLDDPALIPEYASFAAYWPWRLILSVAALVAAALFGCYLILRRIDVARARLAPAAILLVALIGLDFAGRTHAGHQFISINLATSSFVRGFNVVSAWINSKGFTYRRLETPSMASELRGAASHPARILSVSVESLGLSRDRRFNEAVFAPLTTALGADYAIAASSHRFEGGTLSGEIRELCGVKSLGTPTRAQALGLATGCAPRTMKALGYRTLAVHGNTRFFYNRAEVYPAIGFDGFASYEVLLPRFQRTCRTKVWAGICDRDTIAAALAFLDGQDRGFAHVMTLDTHFPLGSRLLGDTGCGRTPEVKDPELCLYANQMAAVMATLAREVRAARNRPDVIYVYGDHAPPFVAGAERDFFDRRSVPFLTLTRR